MIQLDIPLEQGPELLRAARRQGLHEVADILEAELVSAALVEPDYVRPLKLKLDEVHEYTQSFPVFRDPVMSPWGTVSGPRTIGVKVRVLTTSSDSLRALQQQVGRAFVPVFERPRR